MKITLYTFATSHNGMPAREIEIDAELVLANDVILDGEFNPHNVRLWVIGNEFGELGAVWAGNEQDALDILCDEGMSAGLMVDEPETEEEREELTHLGNAGELHDLTYCWMQEVDFEPSRDWKTLCRFAEARGGCYANMDF